MHQLQLQDPESLGPARPGASLYLISERLQAGKRISILDRTRLSLHIYILLSTSHQYFCHEQQINYNLHAPLAEAPIHHPCI